MSATTKIAVGVASGYLLGRTKKLKLAITVGSLLAGRRIATNPQALLAQSSQLIDKSPELKKLQSQITGKLFDAAKGAALNTATSRLELMSSQLRAGRDDDQYDDEYEDEDEPYEDEAEAEEEPADEGDEDEAAKSPRTKRKSPRTKPKSPRTKPKSPRTKPKSPRTKPKSPRTKPRGARGRGAPPASQVVTAWFQSPGEEVRLEASAREEGRHEEVGCQEDLRQQLVPAGRFWQFQCHEEGCGEEGARQEGCGEEGARQEGCGQEGARQEGCGQEGARQEGGSQEDVLIARRRQEGELLAIAQRVQEVARHGTY